MCIVHVTVRHTLHLRLIVVTVNIRVEASLVQLTELNPLGMLTSRSRATVVQGLTGSKSQKDSSNWYLLMTQLETTMRVKLQIVILVMG